MIKKIINRVYDLQYKFHQYWWRQRSQNSVVQGKCIVFHHITDEYIDTLQSCQCKIDVFQSILQRIAQEKISFVSIDRALSIMDSQSNEKFALITFDDVPSDMFENGYPILKKMKVPFTVFITVGFIDTEGFLSSEQLSILNSDPLCTIGAHTLTHSQLRYSKESCDEICRSKKELENIIGKTIDYFAYPFGRVSTISRKNIVCVKRAGYKCAFSTISSDISDYTSKRRWFLPRVVINK